MSRLHMFALTRVLISTHDAYLARTGQMVLSYIGNCTASKHKQKTEHTPCFFFFFFGLSPVDQSFISYTVHCHPQCAFLQVRLMLEEPQMSDAGDGGGGGGQ